MNSTMRARACDGLMTEVFIPPLQKCHLILESQFSHTPQFACGKSVGVRDLHGLKPQFGLPIRLLDVNVRRLLALAAVEEEPETLDSEQSRHIVFLSLAPVAW